MSINIWVYLGIAIILVGGATGIYYKIYHAGEQNIIVKQEKKLNTLKDKTDAIQDDALTTDDPRGRMRKYSRPD